MLFNCKNEKFEASSLEHLYPKKDIKIKYHNSYAIKHYPKRIKQFKKDPLKKGDIVFIGNSLTEGGGNWSKKLGIPNIKNRGIGGDIADGVLKRLDEITFFKPKMVFLLIGVNDLDNMVHQKQIPSVHYVANNIFKIANVIHTKSPETKIYIQTLLPTLDGLINQHILEINNMIKHEENNNNYEVIDLHAAFTESTIVKKELYRDRLHLNKLGYKVWTNVISDYLK